MLACPRGHASRSTMRSAQHGRTRANSCDLNDSSRTPVPAFSRLRKCEKVRRNGNHVRLKLPHFVFGKASYRKLSAGAAEELAEQFVSLKNSAFLIEVDGGHELSCSPPAAQRRCLSTSYRGDRGRCVLGHLRIEVIRARKMHIAPRGQGTAYTNVLRRSVPLLHNWRTGPLRS